MNKEINKSLPSLARPNLTFQLDNIDSDDTSPTDTVTDNTSPTIPNTADLKVSIPPTGISDLFEAAYTEDVAVSDKAEKKKITKKDLEAIVSDIARIYDTSTSLAYIGLCTTLQAGGTNKNKRSNVKITINNITFESIKVNEVIYRIVKNITPRQFARCIANDIFHIAVKHMITGNAYVSLKRYYPQLLLNSNPLETYWAADFQVDNIYCPDYIRTALRQRYADKFTANKKKQ
ncbi:hypothetical protein [Agrobacterium sp.]|uniref:hypothetical protein n=1 Tax=Agrobacterium sp. TaxID=361 RepID=UPI004033B8AF